MQSVSDIREFFIDALKGERFTVDRTGQKTIEMLGACFVADEPAIFGTPNQDYIDAEIDWYIGCSTNINDIPYGDEPPKAWQHAANSHGEINSNYGQLIFSDTYYRQFDNALNELLYNMDSRRASMIYNRPSIWSEFNAHDKNDFICTNAVTYYLRDGSIHAVVQMRSNDVVFGYKNDYAWQQYVLEELTRAYNYEYMMSATDADYRKDMKVGSITWQVQNLHVYEKHFELVKS